MPLTFPLRRTRYAREVRMMERKLTHQDYARLARQTDEEIVAAPQA